MKIPWLVRVVLYPDVELDLVDKQGKPDHAKIMGYYAFTNFMVLAWFGKMPDLGVVIVLNAVIYGWVGLRAYFAWRGGNSA